MVTTEGDKPPQISPPQLQNAGTPQKHEYVKKEAPQYLILLNPSVATTTTTIELEKSSFTKIFEGDFFPPIFVYQRDYL